MSTDNNHSVTSLNPTMGADELALRIGELELFMLLFGIAIAWAIACAGGSGGTMVPVSPSRAGASGTTGYAGKPVVVQVTPQGLKVGRNLIDAHHLKDLKDISGRTVLVEPERGPEVVRLLEALSDLRDAGAAVHVIRTPRKETRQ